ncbi:hypothetical protein CBR_g74641 [Chara braunii]|uniref:TPPC8 second Ig-like domain-containing protein n=1 Tax=Chara braunii TaxID=69332 RepID=A0A388KA50_CHABU|nr:hypothetical protein CBR_g74641 [Chara braunii]|eukprot:GBG66954.1 hypothetical protein CBR_g74641 [Chara braunii]
MAAFSFFTGLHFTGILRSSSVSSLERRSEGGDEKEDSFSDMYHSFHEGVGRVASFSGLRHADRKELQSELEEREEIVDGSQGEVWGQGGSLSDASLERSFSSQLGDRVKSGEQTLEQLDPQLEQYRNMDAQTLGAELTRLVRLSETDKNINLYIVYILCEKLAEVPPTKNDIKKFVDEMAEPVKSSPVFRLLEQRHGSKWQGTVNSKRRGNGSASGTGSEADRSGAHSDSGNAEAEQSIGGEPVPGNDKGPGQGEPGPEQGEPSRQAENGAEPSLYLPEESFSLKPGETAKVRLRVQTLKEGTLKVTGVEWVLCSVAKGCRMFPVGPKRKRLPKGDSRAARGKRTVPPSQRLSFRVIQRMPRLEAVLHEFPEKVHEGELRRMVLELTNTGLVPLRRMRIKFSHPGFLCMGQQSDLDPEFPLCLDVSATRRALSARLESMNTSAATDPLAFALPDIGSGRKGHVFSFSPGTRLDGGSTLLWPLWLHARQSGIQTFHMLVYYEPAVEANGAEPSMKYRTLRMMHDIQVVPSLRVSVKITPSPQNVEHYVARVDVENQSQQDAFMLRQFSCWSPAWRLVKMTATPGSVEDIAGESSSSVPHDAASADTRQSESSAYPVHLVSPAMYSSLYFHLQPRVPTPVEDMSPTAPSISVKGHSPHHPPEPPHSSSGADPAGDKCGGGLSTNLRLGSGNSTLPLIDISMGPTHRFHLRERALQSATSAQRDSSPTGKRSVLDEDVIKDSEYPSACPQSVDFVLLWEHRRTRESWTPSRTEQLSTFGSHHLCHCSVTGPTPVRWVLEVPSCVSHDFASSASVEVPLSLVVQNCSDKAASIRIETLDPVLASSSLPLSASEGGGKSTPRGGGGSLTAVSNTSSLSSKGGWYKLVATERVASTSSSGSGLVKQGLPGGPVSVGSALAGGNQNAELFEEHLCSVPQLGPFLWIGSSCRVLKGLEPGKKARVPLRISVFAPGVYDLCYYRISWRLEAEPNGTCTSPVFDGTKARRGSAQPGRSPTRTPPRHSASSARGPYLRSSDSMSRSFSSYQSLPNSPLSQAGDAPQRHPSSVGPSRTTSAATATAATAGGNSTNSVTGDALGSGSGGSGRALAESEVLSTVSGTLVDASNDGWNSGSMGGHSVLLTVLDSGI